MRSADSGTGSRWIAGASGSSLHVLIDEPSELHATVVLVHGYALAARVWDPVAELLRAEGVRVVRPDLAGHGHSPAAQIVDLDTLADDLHEVMRCVQVDDAGSGVSPPVVLVGHSMGGMVVMHMLRRYPQWCQRLTWILWLATSAGRMSSSSFGLPSWAARWVGPTIVAAGPRVMGWGSLWNPDRRPRPAPPFGSVEAWHLLRANFGQRPPRQTLDAVLAMHHRVPYRVLSQLLAAIARHDEVDSLAQVTLPSVVLIGERDRMTPPEHSTRLAQVLPVAELTTLPGAGHLLMLEQPETISATILRGAGLHPQEA